MTSSAGPCPSPRNHHYTDSVRAALLGTALGDTVGYPLEMLTIEQIESAYRSSGEGLAAAILEESHAVSDDTQLSLYTLDGLCEALEWNNRGTPADETACIWLALLRWYRAIGETPSPSAPPTPSRTIDTYTQLQHRRGPGKATLVALGSGQMQTLHQHINPQALGTGALVRSAVLGFLPLDSQEDLVLLATRVAALTHGHPQAIISACAYTLLVRYTLAYRGSDMPCQQAATDTIRWLSSLPRGPWQHGGDTLTALQTALDNGNNRLSPRQADSLFGTCWLAPAVLGRGLQAALSAETGTSGLLAALSQAAVSDGDSDSIAAVTGTLLGAGWGTDIFPAAIIQNIEVLPVIDTLLTRWQQQLDPGNSPHI